jgi:hypothetical protein
MLMEAWGRLEGALFDWFMWVTKMEEQIARAIYFSATSFNGRREMLQAVPPLSSLDEPTEAFVKAAIKKAGQYASFRNRVTHGEPIWHPTRFEYVLAEGSRESCAVPDDAITTAQMKIGYLNIYGLYRLLRNFRSPLRRMTDSKPPSPEAYLELVRALPNEACSRQSPQNPPKKKRQPRKPPV